VSGDLAIPQTTPRQAAQIEQIRAPGTVTPAAPDPAAVTAASKRPLTNPSLHIDVALNLVVLQFVDDKGVVTSSIPSAKQLKAYQENGNSGTPQKTASAIKKS
jgi:hypothetical protein